MREWRGEKERVLQRARDQHPCHSSSKRARVTRVVTASPVVKMIAVAGYASCKHSRRDAYRWVDGSQSVGEYRSAV